MKCFGLRWVVSEMKWKNRFPPFSFSLFHHSVLTTFYFYKCVHNRPCNSYTYSNIFKHLEFPCTLLWLVNKRKLCTSMDPNVLKRVRLIQCEAYTVWDKNLTHRTNCTLWSVEEPTFFLNRVTNLLNVLMWLTNVCVKVLRVCNQVTLDSLIHSYCTMDHVLTISPFKFHSHHHLFPMQRHRSSIHPTRHLTRAHCNHCPRSTGHPFSWTRQVRYSTFFPLKLPSYVCSQ